MTISAVLLAHYPERDIENIRIIVKDLQSGTRVPDEIIVFIDDGEIDPRIEGVTIIRSNKSIPVTARLYAASFASSDYVFLIDSDLTVEPGTIEYLADYAKDRPYSVIGFEGSVLRDVPEPYTKGITKNRGNDHVPVDMLIRTWFCPKPIIGLGIYMHALNPVEIGSKYIDDILICMGNRLMQKHSNWVAPCLPDMGVIEIGEKNVGQSMSPEHYKVRDRVCRFLIDKYQNDPTNQK